MHMIQVMTLQLPCTNKSHAWVRFSLWMDFLNALIDSEMSSNLDSGDVFARCIFSVALNNS